jgi:hypothetical protein
MRFGTVKGTEQREGELSASACLSTTDAKDCLARVAMMALAAEKTAESRVYSRHCQ